jgi:hypothetical protein
MQYLRCCLLAIAALFVLTAKASAAIVTYTATALGGSQFRYDYTIENNDSFSYDEITIFFGADQYADLADPVAPTGWDSIVVQPDTFLGDGFFDVLTMGVGLAPAETLSGLSVIFSFLGTGAPGSQLFEIVDPLTFDVLASGRTRVDDGGVVPVPGALVLFLSGLAAARVARRRST